MNRKGMVSVLLSGLVLFSGLLALPGRAVAAEAPEPMRTVDATGHGRLQVKPDTATINLGVTQLKPSPAEAYAAMGQDLNKIADAMKAAGVKEEAMQTSVFNLSAEYNWTQEKGQVLAGYRATTTLSITTQELDNVATLIQTAVNAGANQLQGVSFSVKDPEGLMDKALDAAVDDARAKAERVAKRLGGSVGKATRVSISDGGMPIFRDVWLTGSKNDAAPPAPVFSGTTTITVDVSITFELK